MFICCINSSSLAVLINDSTSSFFISERGLCQGFPLSPLLFLIVAKGLSRAILYANRRGSFLEIRIANNLNITHLLFMGDILIFCDGLIKDAEKLLDILTLFGRATCMILNEQNSNLTPINMEDLDLQRYTALFPFTLNYLDDGIKYLGLRLKPNNYKKEYCN